MYAGYGFEASEGVNVDLTYVYYVYPGETDTFNYSEFQAGVSFNDISLGLVYSPDYFGSDDSAVIVSADYSIGLADNLGLDLHVGYTDTDGPDSLGIADGEYIDYSAGLTTTVSGLDFSLTYYGTDVDNTATADDRVVFAMAKSF